MARGSFKGLKAIKMNQKHEKNIPEYSFEFKKKLTYFKV